jgi:hypothetical protein
MSFWISFSDILYFTRNARKTPLIPEGFVLETPPEHKGTAIRLRVTNILLNNFHRFPITSIFSCVFRPGARHFDRK